MALNKAKVLKSAEKYVVQGKISHAISEYQKLIKEDPTDLPLVNTLGDLYVRIGNIPEAVKCFTRLAESYDNGGFVVRAIAMYKKVGKIDPAQIQALSRLADLYLRQGLNSDARTHYLQVADYLIKKGDLENALGIYQKIIGIDPENPAADGRIAEVYQKLGNKQGAIAALVSAAAKARRKTALEEGAGYLKKARELDENNLEVLLAYAEVLSELGRTSEALAALSRIPLHDFRPEVLEASFRIHLKSKNLNEAEKIADQLIELDDQYFKLQAAVSNAFFLQGDLDKAAQVGKIAETAIRHGEGTIAESQLKSILHQTPDHIPAILELIKYYSLSKEHQNIPGLLEKVGATYVRRDQLAEAASIYLQLVQVEPNDPVHRENLRQIQERLGLSEGEIQLPKLVPDMGLIAEKFLSEPTLLTLAPEEGINKSAVDSADEHEKIKGFIVEGDLCSGYGQYQKAIEQYQRVTEVIPHHIEAHERIRDTYAKTGELTKAAQECLILANIFTTRNDTENANRNFMLAYQYDASLHQQPINPESNVATSTGSKPQSSTSSHGVQTKRLEELLQEVDFYLDLGFLSEAKSSIDQYLQIGNAADTEFQKRLKRYESLLHSKSGKRDSDGSKAVMPLTPETIEATEEINIGGFESTSVATSEEIARPVEIEKTTDFESTSVAEQSDRPTELKTLDSFNEMTIDLDQELVESSLEKPAAPAASAGHPGQISSASQRSAFTEALEDVFEEFREGIEDESDSGDYETHYNLGIAFKEMGLFEEAIGEFQKALRIRVQDTSTEEFVRCCNMLGLCFIEKGLPQVAMKWFAKGLASPGQNEETYQALRYDLGCAHEMAGNTQAALETFLDVYGVNINYRDISEKIENLKHRING
jgi:tetratricopeptide (TPR) repeat protein